MQQAEQNYIYFANPNKFYKLPPLYRENYKQKGDR